MATLIPAHTKVEPLRFPSYLIAQVFDIFEDMGISNHNLDNTSTSSPTFISSESSTEFSDTLRNLLDGEKLRVARFPSSWWITGEAKSIALKTDNKREISQRINDVSRRHFYFRTDVVVISDDIDFDTISSNLEERLADLSAFMKISRGFWLNWK